MNKTSRKRSRSRKVKRSLSRKVKRSRSRKVKRSRSRKVKRSLSRNVKSTIVMKKSNKSDKKYMVIITDSKGKKKTTHFGAKGYSDYTKHKDAERKDRYITRHKAKENWNKSGINTPGFWSRWILWNKPGLKSSIRDTERRFKIKIN